ncbi:response regulator transcription factor [Sporomusa acidovorans]|uniref:Oxygen regulatory protein NreC n=1 Tax=Sporomusa acidovorans (strain ATCC 49682 / DSM 3132 / Mol) TaxID=1123286 RepID=A0ABZ3J9R8_SPOA4|nr:response regulator transcription factor [Sporomusa acidovorans]OZC16261.1 oxygen regulatory protein NreC [Sporomusa acidovorans DSM 3132]SDE33084.1 two component transcriptional regulator, LuxR family [Sporomusa acidovorans]
MKQKLKVLLADDHKLLRSGLKLLLQRNPGMQVVGEAADGEQTIQLFEQLQPDILLLDLSMPNMDGIECLKEIKSRYPEAKVIVLTMHEDENYIKRAMQAGASAYVPKSAADTDLFTAIEAVQAGGIYLSQQDSNVLLNVLLNREQEAIDKKAPYVLLSPREREVLRLVAHGYSLAEVAERLALSIKTVDTYKVRLMEKLKATKRSQLVSYALKYGLLSTE